MSVLNTVPKYRGKGIHVWAGLLLLVFMLIQSASGILMLVGDHAGRYGGRDGGPAAQFRNAPGNAPMIQGKGAPMGQQGVLAPAGVIMQNSSFMPGRLNGNVVTQPGQLGNGTAMPQQGQLSNGGVVPQPGQLNGGAADPQINGNQLAQSFGGGMGRHGGFNSMGDPNMQSGFGVRYDESNGLSVRGIHGSWLLAIATLILLLIHVYYSLGLHFFGFKHGKKQAKKEMNEAEANEVDAPASSLKPGASQGALPEMS